MELGLTIRGIPALEARPRSAVIVAELLAATAREDGVAVVCATHDSSVTAHADRVTSLRSGRVAEAVRERA